MQTGSIMRLCFNELTLQPLCIDDSDIFPCVKKYAETLQSVLNGQQTLKVIYEKDISEIYLNNNTSLRDFCKKNIYLGGARLILASCRSPFDSSMDADVRKRFENTSVSVQMEDKEVFSQGLTAAYAYNSPSVGFYTDRWSQIFYAVHIIEGDADFSDRWPCLTCPEDVNDDKFKAWLEQHSKVELLKTSKLPKEKAIKLSDDHGKDVLKKHAKRLLNSEYVLEVLTSLPYAQKCKRYISSVYDDGTIDIVLHWENPRYSMRIRTTGRNLAETEEIAKILLNKYS